MSSFISRFRRVELSTWIAFASLLLSVPAIILSASQWRAQRNYDVAKETIEYLDTLQDAREAIKVMQDSLSTLNFHNIDPYELSDLREEVDGWAEIYQKWWIESTPLSKDEAKDVASQHMLTGLIRLQIRLLQNQYNRTLPKAHIGAAAKQIAGEQGVPKRLLRDK